MVHFIVQNSSQRNLRKAVPPFIGYHLSNMPLFGHKNKASHCPLCVLTPRRAHLEQQKRTPSPLGGTNATRNDPAYGQTAGNATTGSNWDQNNASANTNPTNDPGFNDHNSYGSQKGGGTTANQRSGFGADYAQGPGSAAGDTAAGGTTGTGIGSGGTGVHVSIRKF